MGKLTAYDVARWVHDQYRELPAPMALSINSQGDLTLVFTDPEQMNAWRELLGEPITTLTAEGDRLQGAAVVTSTTRKGKPIQGRIRVTLKWRPSPYQSRKEGNR